MITISISADAYRAIAGGTPEPSLRDDRGGYRFIVDCGTLDRLTAARGPGESSDVNGSSCQRARARGSRQTGAVMWVRTDSALSTRAIGGAEVDRLASAKSASAAAAPATRAALNGRTG